MALEFTKDNFDSEVLQSDQPVLVDFWAEWCGPCKMIGPLVDSVASETEGTAKVGKVNVDSEQELARTYGIQNANRNRARKSNGQTNIMSGNRN